MLTEKEVRGLLKEDSKLLRKLNRKADTPAGCSAEEYEVIDQLDGAISRLREVLQIKR